MRKIKIIEISCATHFNSHNLFSLSEQKLKFVGMYKPISRTK